VFAVICLAFLAVGFFSEVDVYDFLVLVVVDGCAVLKDIVVDVPWGFSLIGFHYAVVYCVLVVVELAVCQFLLYPVEGFAFEGYGYPFPVLGGHFHQSLWCIFNHMHIYGYL